jgi:O-antigen/teichoic acid export membrane protein
MKEFRILTLINMASVLIAIVAAVALMQIVGVQGAILGTATGELMLSVLLYRAIRNN